MTYEDKVLEYIALPENLPVALEVAEAVQKLRDNIHRQFWPLFSTEVNQRLTHSVHAETWKYVSYPLSRLKKEYETCSLQSVQLKGIECPVLSVIFGQGGRDGNYRLLTGVAWGKKIPDPNHPTLKDFKKELYNRKLSVSWDLWPGWKYLDYALEGGEFMAKFYQTPNEVVGELADEYWLLFLDLLPIIEPINQALSQ
jgi:hypothetical protein